MQPSPNPEQTPQVSAPIPMDPIAAAKMQAGMRDVYLKEAYNAVGSNFYTIAVLSIINSVIALFKGNIYFPVGLGLTQIVDVFASALSQEAGSSIFLIIGFVIDLFILGIVAVFGFFIKRKVKWLIPVGSVLYLLDGLILLVFQDWFGAGFHAYFLYRIWTSWKAIGSLTAAVPESAIEVI